MHGLTGGSWKRDRDRAGTTELLKGTRGNPVGPALRDLPSILVTAPALDPTSMSVRIKSSDFKTIRKKSI
jgi:hypothetical protein